MQEQHISLTENDNMMAPYLRQKIFLLPQGERSLSQATNYGFFLRKNLQDLASKAKIDLTDKLGQLQKILRGKWYVFGDLGTGKSGQFGSTCNRQFFNYSIWNQSWNGGN